MYPVRLRHAALAFTLGCLCASARAETDDALLDRLIERSGLQGKLVQLEAMMRRGTDELAARNPRMTDYFARVRLANARAYAPTRLQPILRQELEGELSRADVEAVLARSDSPAELRLAALARQATSPADRARIEAALASGHRQVLEPRRSELLHELVRAARVDELSAALLIAASVGAADGYAEGAPASSRATVQQMRRGMDSDRPALVAAMHEQNVAAYGLVYADATDADLEDALRFARSEAGERFYRVSTRAFEATAERAARDFAIEMSRSVPAAPAQ